MRSEELDKFCQVVIAAMKSIRKANDIPAYFATKARDVNAGYILEQLNEKLDTNALKELLKTPRKMKVCSEEGFRTKEDIVKEIEEIKPFMDRIRNGGYKLMLDRYLAAYDLAIKFAEVAKELESNYEMELKEEKRSKSF